MKVQNPAADPHAHKMEREIATLAGQLAQPWNGHGHPPDAERLLTLATESFNQLWTTAKANADAATLIRAVARQGKLYVTASKGRAALSLDVHVVLDALIATTRSALPDSGLPENWSSGLQHNARCLVLTVDRMHTSGLEQTDAYHAVLDEQLRERAYPHVNVLLSDGTFEQRAARHVPQN